MGLFDSRTYKLSTGKASDEDVEILQYIRTDLTKSELLLTSNNTVFFSNESKVHCLKMN
jgi:hypothetical protein